MTIARIQPGNPAHKAGTHLGSSKKISNQIRMSTIINQRTNLFNSLMCAGMICFLGLSSCSPEKKEAQEEKKEAKQELKAVEKQARKIEPRGEEPAWGKGITNEMLAVIEALDSLGPKPLPTLTAKEARMQPTPADAAMAIMDKYDIPMPTPRVDTTGKSIAVSDGQIHARIYTPQTGKAMYPVIVYYHGGGWVIATIDTYNASAQALAEQSEAIVVAVEYRKAPEFKFNTAHQDAFTAYEWTLENAASFKGDAARVAVVGESAGGNMAIAVSMMARDAKIMLPLHQVAVYPVADYTFKSESYSTYAEAKPLNKAGMEWFFKNYLKSAAQGSKSPISLLKANLTGLPPTTIIGAEIDPLQTEGKLLADRLEEAKVSTTYKLYKGVTHEFFGMGLILPEAKDAQGVVAKALRDAFDK